MTFIPMDLRVMLAMLAAMIVMAAIDLIDPR